MQQWKESQLSARELGLQVHSKEVSTTEKYESAFKEAIQAGSAALAVTQSALTNKYQRRLRTSPQRIGCRLYTLGEIL